MSSDNERTNRLAAAIQLLIGHSVLTNERIARSLGLNVVDLQTLGFIARGGGPVSPSQLAETTGMPTSTITRVIDRLEAAGYVHRHPDPADRRRIKVIIDPDRYTEVASRYEGITTRLGDMHSQFTHSELDTVVRYLDALTAEPDPS